MRFFTSNKTPDSWLIEHCGFYMHPLLTDDVWGRMGKNKLARDYDEVIRPNIPRRVIIAANRRKKEGEKLFKQYGG